MATFTSNDHDHPLNNGYVCRIVDEERTFTSVEQYMMWHKARTFPGNETVMQSIMDTSDYATIKSLGRAVVNFDAERQLLAKLKTSDVLKHDKGMGKEWFRATDETDTVRRHLVISDIMLEVCCRSLHRKRPRDTC